MWSLINFRSSLVKFHISISSTISSTARCSKWSHKRAEPERNSALKVSGDGKLVGFTGVLDTVCRLRLFVGYFESSAILSSVGKERDGSWFDESFYLPICLAQQPSMGQGLIVHDVSRSHTTTHHSQYDSSGWVISSSLRPLPGIQQSQHTNIHASSGIRTHNLNRREAADLRLRPRGHWDRHSEA